MRQNGDWLDDLNEFMLPEVGGRTFIHQSPLLTPIIEGFEEVPRNLTAYDTFYDLRSYWPTNQLNDSLALSEPPSHFLPTSERISNQYSPHPQPSNFLEMSDLNQPLHDIKYEEAADSSYDCYSDHARAWLNGTSAASSPAQSFDEGKGKKSPEEPRKKRKLPGKIRRDSSTASESISDTEKRYPCTRCHMRYGKSSHLNTHMNMHLDLKKYKCPREGCPKAFYRNDLLNRHLRGPEHDNIKDVPCPDCPKMFRRADNMKEHRRRAHPDYD